MITRAGFLALALVLFAPTAARADGDVEGFLRSFANATSFASRGVGVDYAPLFRGLELGVTANIAAAVDGLEEGDDPVGGVAPNLSIIGGRQFR